MGKSGPEYCEVVLQPNQHTICKCFPEFFTFKIKMIQIWTQLLRAESTSSDSAASGVVTLPKPNTIAMIQHYFAAYKPPGP